MGVLGTSQSPSYWKRDFKVVEWCVSLTCSGFSLVGCCKGGGKCGKVSVALLICVWAGFTGSSCLLGHGRS